MFCPLKEILLLCVISCSFLVCFWLAFKINQKSTAYLFQTHEKLPGVCLSGRGRNPWERPSWASQKLTRYYLDYKHRNCVVARKPRFRSLNPPRHVRIGTSVCVAARKPRFRSGNPPRHVRIGTSVCVLTSGDDSPSSTAARRTSHCRMQAHPVLAVILSLLVTLLDYVQKWDIFDIVDEIKASLMTKLNGLL